MSTITDWLFGFATPEVERRWRPVLENSIRAVSSSLIGNVAISVVAGTVAGLSAWAFGLPFPIVLAVITGFLNLSRRSARRSPRSSSSRSR